MAKRKDKLRDMNKLRIRFCEILLDWLDRVLNPKTVSYLVRGMFGLGIFLLGFGYLFDITGDLSGKAQTDNMVVHFVLSIQQSSPAIGLLFIILSPVIYFLDRTIDYLTLKKESKDGAPSELREEIADLSSAIYGLTSRLVIEAGRNADPHKLDEYKKSIINKIRNYNWSGNPNLEKEFEAYRVFLEDSFDVEQSIQKRTSTAYLRHFAMTYERTKKYELFPWSLGTVFYQSERISRSILLPLLVIPLMAKIGEGILISIEPTLVFDLPVGWYLTFFGAMFLLIGRSSFYVYCPDLIRRYHSLEKFLWSDDAKLFGDFPEKVWISSNTSSRIPRNISGVFLFVGVALQASVIMRLFQYMFLKFSQQYF